MRESCSNDGLFSKIYSHYDQGPGSLGEKIGTILRRTRFVRTLTDNERCHHCLRERRGGRALMFLDICRHREFDPPAAEVIWLNRISVRGHVTFQSRQKVALCMAALFSCLGWLGNIFVCILLAQLYALAIQITYAYSVATADFKEKYQCVVFQLMSLAPLRVTVAISHIWDVSTLLLIKVLMIIIECKKNFHRSLILSVRVEIAHLETAKITSLW